MRKSHRGKDLPNFPWKGRFTTKEEIDDYFADEERIQCLLCGKWFKKLGPHLSKTHGVSQDEYRERFGLPWKRGLFCKRLSDRYSRVMTKRIEEGFNPTPSDAARKKSHETPRRNDQPFFRNLKSKQLKKINDSRKAPKPEAYEMVLIRMIENRKTLREVCEDEDLPTLGSVYRYRELNPAFKQKLNETYHALPYSVQARAKRLSPQFDADILRLSEEGLTMYDIASKLGVSVRVVKDHLKCMTPETSG